MWKIVLIVALLFGALAGSVALDRPLPDADLTIIIPVEYNTLDPQRMSFNHDFRLNYAIYETLVRWDTLGDFEIVPGAASSWSSSGDGLEYTFVLREGARWSNGAPVTAGDFEYSWRRGIMPDTAADYAKMFFAIAGAKEFFEWRSSQLESYAERPASERTVSAARELLDEALAKFDEMVGIEAVDDRTLVVRLERPTPFFLDLTAFGVFAPVHPPLLEAHKALDAYSGRVSTDYSWTKPPKLVTNGPYVPTVWKFKRAMFLERNAHFHSPGLAKSDTIKILPIPDKNTSVLAYETGIADLHADVRVDYIPEMLAARERGEEVDIVSAPTFGTYFWSFNCTPTLVDGRANPFADARVRRAFALATDKELLVNNVRRTGEKVARVFVPPGSIVGFDSPSGLGHDPARARREMSAAGWEDRDGDGLVENERGEAFPVVEMLYSTGSYHEDMALTLGRMWEEELGVRTKLDGKETKVYRDEVKSQNFMMARGGWFGDYGDPTTFHYLHRTGDGNNDRGYSDPYVDDLLDRVDAEPDAEKRMAMLEEIERYTMEETVPILPIFHYDWYYLYRSPTGPDGEPNPGGLRNVSKHPRLVQYKWILEVVGERGDGATVRRGGEGGDGGGNGEGGGDSGDGSVPASSWRGPVLLRGSGAPDPAGVGA